MSWRLEINHTTRYRYDRPVVASYNEARVTPLTTPDQVVSETSFAVSPDARVFAYRDYWGSLVHSFDVHDAHETLVVTSNSVVETAVRGARAYPSTAAGAQESAPCSWEELGDSEVLDRFYELLAPSCLVGMAELAGAAAALRSSCPTPALAVPAATRWAHDQLEYRSGATHVHSSAADAWKAGKGVCQDFAHLSLAVLRAMGVPARYVSGYFYPGTEGVIGLKVVGESHAWVEAWTGDWGAHDPTNLVPVAERHVVVARGRDYSDVAPMRGIFSGPPGSTTDVTVELVRQA